MFQQKVLRRAQLYGWILATRPKLLSFAIMPPLVGTLLVPLSFHEIQWSVLFWALCVMIFLQLGTQFINDVLDANRGVDQGSRLGPIRGIQQGILKPNHVHAVGLGCLVIAFFCGIPLAMKGGAFLVLILLLSVISGYCYTGGPYPLSYSGLAELFLLVFYGWVAVVTLAYLQTGVISWVYFVVGTQMGLLSIVPLALNNFRDMQSDGNCGKKTLAVRFGKTFARWEISLAAMLPFIMGFLLLPVSPLAAFLPWLCLPGAIIIVYFVWNHEPSRLFNRYLAVGGIFHLAFGGLLILGFRL